jgi:branched-chain amino acid transport system substrate-binding protein
MDDSNQEANSESNTNNIQPGSEIRPTPANQPETAPADAPVTPAAAQVNEPAAESAAPAQQPQTFTPAAPDASSPQPPTVTAAQEAQPKKLLRVVIPVIAGVVVLGLLAFGGMTYSKSVSKQAAPPTVKVGVMMAFSGGSSSMGYGANKGIQLAKKQLNATNLEFVQVDSKCDAKTAAQSVKNLIAKNVIAIIGEGCSSASVAALPAANNAKIPMISPSASSPTLSIPNDYFYRVVPPDTMQGAFMAQTIYNRGLHNIAIFYTNEPYGSGMNKVFREKFESLGGKVTVAAFAEPDVIDLATQVKTIKDSSPQALFIAPNSVVSATAIMRLTREAGVNVPFFGADIMYDNTIINNNPTAAEGLTISSFPTGTKTFKQALVNEYQKTEQLYAAPQAYDIVKILQTAVQKGAKTGEDVKNILPSISIEGVSGFKKFDANGEVGDKDYKYDLFTVKSGAFSLVEQ